MTVIVTAVFRAAEGKAADLIDALTKTIPGVHEEAGCALYAIHDAEDGTITMIEKWDSVAELDAHGAGPAVAALSAAVTPLLDGTVTVTRMTPLPAGTDEQGLL